MLQKYTLDTRGPTLTVACRVCHRRVTCSFVGREYQTGMISRHMRPRDRNISIFKSKILEIYRNLKYPRTMESERIGPFLKVASGFTIRLRLGSRTIAPMKRRLSRLKSSLSNTRPPPYTVHHRLYRLPANEILLQRLTDLCTRVIPRARFDSSHERRVSLTRGPRYNS